MILDHVLSSSEVAALAADADHDGAADFWGLGELPQIQSIADETILETESYTGPTPTLLQGAPPITWSLAAGPAGMTIDPDTGVVSWPSPSAAGGNPVTVTVRAENSLGSAETSWELFIIPTAIVETYGCFIEQLYQGFLGRAPDRGGYLYYLEQLFVGELTPEEMVYAFISSSEFSFHHSFIMRCYFAIFNNNSATDYRDPAYRFPDHQGVRFWKEVMEAHGSDYYSAQLDVIDGFLASQKWQERLGALSDEEFVDFLHEHILGREPDAGGRAWHLGNLAAGYSTRHTLVRDFICSPEAFEKYRNHTYVAMAYLGLLERTPDREGFVYQLDYLSGPLTGNPGNVFELLRGFIYAPEYISRLAGIGCVFPGG